MRFFHFSYLLFSASVRPTSHSLRLNGAGSKGLLGKSSALPARLHSTCSQSSKFRYLSWYFMLAPDHATTQRRRCLDRHSAYGVSVLDNRKAMVAVHRGQKVASSRCRHYPCHCWLQQHKRKVRSSASSLHLLQLEWAQTFAQKHGRCKMVRKDLLQGTSECRGWWQTPIHGIPKWLTAC